MNVGLCMGLTEQGGSDTSSWVRFAISDAGRNCSWEYEQYY